jgi:hypothetical protein
VCAALFNSKTTPMSVDLTSAQAHTVTFRIVGMTPVTCLLNRKVGVQWVILDVLGGLIPVVVDAATGSWYELDKNVCNGTLSGEELDITKLDPALQASYAGTY